MATLNVWTSWSCQLDLIISLQFPESFFLLEWLVGSPTNWTSKDFLFLSSILLCKLVVGLWPLCSCTPNSMSTTCLHCWVISPCRFEYIFSFWSCLDHTYFLNCQGSTSLCTERHCIILWTSVSLGRMCTNSQWVRWLKGWHGVLMPQSLPMEQQEGMNRRTQHRVGSWKPFVVWTWCWELKHCVLCKCEGGDCACLQDTCSWLSSLHVWFSIHDAIVLLWSTPLLCVRFWFCWSQL